MISAKELLKPAKTQGELMAYRQGYSKGLAFGKRQSCAWQPIDTAPNDGSCVLVGNKYGAWVAKYMPVYPSGFRPNSPWFCMMLNRDYMEVIGDLPTHWMPLPEPPK